jgi:hypothetical protein
MFGACVSFTVTVNEQEAGLPDASVTEQFTVVTPLLKTVPEDGEQLGAPTPGQLSLTVGVGYDTTAVQMSGSVL